MTSSPWGAQRTRELPAMRGFGITKVKGEATFEVRGAWRKGANPYSANQTATATDEAPPVSWLVTDFL